MSGDISGPSVRGIDVSHWQSSTPSLDGVHFLIARATIGTATDETYNMHIANAKAAGILTGAYHFNYAGISVAAQVAAFLQKAGNVDGFVVDREGANAFSPAQCREFISRVQATGRRIGLYESESIFSDLGQDWNWIANYSQEPRKAYDMWQYGPLHGADGNVYAGTLADLQALWGAGADMSIFLSYPEKGHFNIPANATVKKYKSTPTGFVAAPTDTWSGHSATTVTYTAHLKRSYGTEAPTSLLGGLSGSFAGFYVSTAEVTEIADAPPVIGPAADCSAVEASLAISNTALTAANAVVAKTQGALDTATRRIAAARAALDS